MTLDLLLPGLAWPADNVSDVTRDLDLPALGWLLSRATLSPHATTAFEEVAAGLFGLEQAPVARIGGLADGLDTRQGHWLRADPVFLRPERDALVLADSGIMHIEQREADALVAALNRFFVGDGLVFHAPAPDRWYVERPSPFGASFTRLESVIGDNIDRHLPRGAEAMQWHRWLNEVQMLLFAEPVNAERESAGEPVINSVWFWGEGDWPSVTPTSRYRQVLADAPLLRGLASLSGVESGTVPFAFAGLPAGAMDGDTLVLIDRLEGAAQYRDAWGWREALQALERDWFVPLAAALRAGRPGHLRILVPGPRGFSATLTPAARWQCWKRPRTLARLL